MAINYQPGRKYQLIRDMVAGRHHPQSNAFPAKYRSADYDTLLHKNYQAGTGRWRNFYKTCQQGKCHDRVRSRPAGFRLKLRIRPESSGRK